jgi:hypothetical protein
MRACAKNERLSRTHRPASARRQKAHRVRPPRANSTTPSTRPNAALMPRPAKYTISATFAAFTPTRTLRGALATSYSSFRLTAE